MCKTPRKEVSPKSAVYWIPTFVLFMAFAFSGIALMINFAPLAEGMAHLGYPAYILPLIGAWKLAGALVILLPRMPLAKEWAYAGIAIDLSGAIVSRYAVGDINFELALPIMLSVAAYVSWSKRPKSRRLCASGTSSQEA